MQQQTKEWHDLRQTKIGASDAPVIMGVSPYKTPRQLWEVKVGMMPRNQNSTEYQQRGIDLERRCKEIFQRDKGIKVNADVKIHSHLNFMMASFDGIDSTGKVVVEFKCPGKVDHEKAQKGEVPAKYYPQVQHQMEVAGIESMFYMSYFSDEDYIILQVYRNDRYITDMIDKEAEFFEYIQNYISPPLVKRDISRIERYNKAELENQNVWEKEKVLFYWNRIPENINAA